MGMSKKNDQRRKKALRRQLLREERERFERMSPAERLELIRFECPVGADTAWSRLMAQSNPYRVLLRCFD